MKGRDLLAFVLAAMLASGCVTLGRGAQSTQAFTSDAEFRHWFTFYYQNPQPESLTSALRYLRANGYLDETQSETRDMPLIASVFLAKVLRQNKSELRQWVGSWQGLGQQEWYVLLVALYMADVPEAKVVMLDHVHRVDKAHQARLAGMQKVSAAALDPLAAPVQNERQINLLWAGFSASGDLRYVRRVVEAVPMYGDADERLAGIGELALMSLATNALQNDLVAHECARINQKTSDRKTRVLLSAMLAAVADIAKNEQRNQDVISH